MYFEQCAPSFCIYFTADPINLATTMTLFVSLYGGLTAILRLIVPSLVNFMFKLKISSIRIATERGIPKASLMSWIDSLCFFLESCCRYLVHLLQWIKCLNLFKSATRRTAEDIKRQRIITRCFLCSFTCASLSSLRLHCIVLSKWSLFLFQVLWSFSLHLLRRILKQWQWLYPTHHYHSTTIYTLDIQIRWYVPVPTVQCHTRILLPCRRHSIRYVQVIWFPTNGYLCLSKLSQVMPLTLSGFIEQKNTSN